MCLRVPSFLRPGSFCEPGGCLASGGKEYATCFVGVLGPLVNQAARPTSRNSACAIHQCLARPACCHKCWSGMARLKLLCCYGARTVCRGWVGRKRFGTALHCTSLPFSALPCLNKSFADIQHEAAPASPMQGYYGMSSPVEDVFESCAAHLGIITATCRPVLIIV